MLDEEIAKRMEPFSMFVDYIWNKYNYRESRRSKNLNENVNSAYILKIEIYFQRFCMETHTHQNRENLVIEEYLQGGKEKAFEKVEKIFEQKMVVEPGTCIVKRPICITAVTIYSTFTNKIGVLYDSVAMYLTSRYFKNLEGHNFGEIESVQAFLFHNTCFELAESFENLFFEFEKLLKFKPNCVIGSNDCRRLLFK